MVICALILSLFLCSCGEKASDKVFYDDFDNIYDEQKNEIFKSQHEVDGYLITNYEDGVCINSCTQDGSYIEIPEEIDGKKVLKLGACYSIAEYDNNEYVESESPLSSNINVLALPKSLKKIDYLFNWNVRSIIVHSENEYYSSDNGVLFDKSGKTLIKMPDHYDHVKYSVPNGTQTVMYVGSEKCKTIYIPESVSKISEFCDVWYEVSENNKYFSSENGVIFNKDKTELLFYPSFPRGGEYVVPESVITLKDQGFMCISIDTLSFGKNIKNIELDLNDYSDGSDGADYRSNYITTIKGYRGTAAENFAKENNLKFIPLD